MSQAEEITANVEAGFAPLGLSEVMLASIAKAEYLEPTPIQAGLIPRALAGVDVLGQARTGTGKTAAFVIPILERVHPQRKSGAPQALILVPTRELAVQVKGEVEKLSHGRRIHSVPLYGGKPIKGQIDKLKKGAEIVVGTPGRILDHLSRGTLNLSELSIVVLDEADRMLDIGFRPDIEKILRRCPASRQTLLLSATVPAPVEKLARRYMRDPESLNFSPKEIGSETIEQFYFTVTADRKFDLLEKLLEREQPRQAIIFCRTKRGTDKVHHRLSKRLQDVACIHGDLGQGARDRVMAGFREGTVRILVATDVVGRGIDVSNISHIINYDIPQFCDDYVHRVGRTGRMGREGIAFTFVTSEEGGELTRIEMRINRLLQRDEIEGFSKLEKPQGDPNSSEPNGRGYDTGEPEAPKKAVPSQLGSKGRIAKRYRRAL
ncbi:MAG TPA: DEAD/DEAH box helicase [Pirellulales bacterium]|jgi:ATP-dependent RNA helicase DeaD|nr:DEAD/DEAH box helicase [Pirellulales bacterium]